MQCVHLRLLFVFSQLLVHTVYFCANLLRGEVILSNNDKNDVKKPIYAGLFRLEWAKTEEEWEGWCGLYQILESNVHIFHIRLH